VIHPAELAGSVFVKLPLTWAKGISLKRRATPAIFMGSAPFQLFASMFTAATKTDANYNSSPASDKAAAIGARYRTGEFQEAIARALGLGREVVRRTLKE